MHEHMAVLDFEITALQKNHPARILNYMIRDLPEGRFRRGYKSPTDVEDGRARNKLGVHYGKTKLLVGLRHPVLWFESFYNHRVQNGYEMPDILEVIRDRGRRVLLNECPGNFRGVCFSRANFHHALAKWGKTPLLFLPGNDTDKRFGYTNYDNDREFSLFTGKSKQNLLKDMNNTDVSPNPMFLYDVNQLRMPPSVMDGNDKGAIEQERVYDDFVLNLQGFLKVPQNVSAMPTMIKEKPGKTKGIDAAEQLRRDGLKIDMCDEKFAMPRKWLLEIGANVHLWIRDYFSKSPHNVFAGGSRGSPSASQFLTILQSYAEDPCPERVQKRKQLEQN